MYSQKIIVSKTQFIGVQIFKKNLNELGNDFCRKIYNLLSILMR